MKANIVKKNLKYLIKKNIEIEPFDVTHGDDYGYWLFI